MSGFEKTVDVRKRAMMGGVGAAYLLKGKSFSSMLAGKVGQFSVRTIAAIGLAYAAVKFKGKAGDICAGAVGPVASDAIGQL